jgi:Flp pilus assembly pilin Flp
MAFLRALARLVTDDCGQDLIEYALLSAAIGLAGIAAFNGMAGVMQTAYSSWVSSADTVANMPDPIP